MEAKEEAYVPRFRVISMYRVPPLPTDGMENRIRLMPFVDHWIHPNENSSGDVGDSSDLQTP